MIDPVIEISRYSQILRETQPLDSQIRISETRRDDQAQNLTSTSNNQLRTEPSSQEIPAEVRENLEQFQETSQQISLNNGQGVFAERNETSSNPDLARIQVEPDATIGDYNLSIENLPQPQVTETQPFFIEDDQAFEPGEYEIQLEQNQSVENITFSVREDEPPLSVLQNLNSLLDNLPLDIENDLIFEKDYMHLELVAPGGSPLVFKDMRGNLTEQLGLETVQETQAPQVFLSGPTEGFEITEDTVIFDQGRIQAQILDRGTTEITVSPDTDDITRDVEDLITGYNQIRELIQNQPPSPALEALDGRLEEIVRYGTSALSQIGIEVRDDGELAIDEETFQRSLGENLNMVESVLADRYGLAQRLEGLLDEVLEGSFHSYSQREDVRLEGEIDFPSIQPFQIYNQAGQTFPQSLMLQGGLINLLM